MASNNRTVLRQAEKPKRGKGRRKPGPDEDRIVEYIRRLMAVNMPPGEIRRTIVANSSRPFDRIKSTKTVQPYLRLARERNQQAIGREAEDSKADSLMFWSRMQLDAWKREQKVLREIPEQEAVFAEGQRRMREALRRQTEVIGKTGAATAERAELAEQAKMWGHQVTEARQRLEQLRRELFTARHEMQDIQDRVDKLLGNHAPTKVARTDTAGSVPPHHIPEPVDPVAEARLLVKEILENRSAKSN